MAEAKALTTTPAGPMGQLNQFFGERALRQIGLVLGLAAAIAAGIGLFMWAHEPSYRPLYTKLSEQDAAAVMDALQAAAIQYKVDTNSGAILVPAADVHKARLQLASQGLPQGASTGFELLQKEQGFGTSQFMENARFHRALETELARSVSALQGVESARVHLAIPKPSVFIREKSAPSASVLVNLQPGRSLTDGQVAAIVHLVSSSVPELPDQNVTVVDERGRLLTQKEDGVLGATTKQLEYKQQVEENYVRRIENLLAPMLGAERVRAQVNAKLNFVVEESTQEVFDPNGAVVRSEQTSEQRTSGLAGAAGVPGALTNQPPQAGTLTPQSTQQPAGTPGNVNSSTTRNFELTKTIRHTRAPVGSIERLSIAVLVDEKETKDADGKTVRQPLSEDEINRIAGLVREAVGFDDKRGDSINVISAAFQQGEEIEPVETSLLENPMLVDIAKAVLAFIVFLLLFFMVIRPILRALMTPVKVVERQQVAVTEREGEEQPKQLGGPEVPQLPGNRPQLPGAGKGGSYEDALTSARAVVSTEPALAVNVVKTWLGQDE